MSCHSNPMSCGHVPGNYADSHYRLAHPLPRWSILPGDPLDLRRWLLARAAHDGGVAGEVTEAPWPEEEAS